MSSLRKTAFGVVLFASTICFNNYSTSDRGWFYMGISEAARPRVDYNLHHVHSELRNIVGEQYKVVNADKSANIACFSIFVNGKKVEGEHQKIIFCSSDEASSTDLEYRLFKMMKDGGEYKQNSFFNHQAAMIQAAERFFGAYSNFCELKEECSQYKSIVKGIEKKLNAVGDKVNKISTELERISDFVISFKNTGATKDNLSQLVNFSKSVDSNLQCIEKSKTELFGGSDENASINHLFHSEQRILYYLLNNNAEKLIELIGTCVECPRAVAIHLHTHKDPCPICGPVLSFANILISNKIREKYGEDVKFDLFVSCSELRERFIAECENINLASVYNSLSACKAKSRQPKNSQFNEESFNAFVGANLAVLLNNHIQLSKTRRMFPIYPLMFLNESEIMSRLNDNHSPSLESGGWIQYKKL